MMRPQVAIIGAGIAGNGAAWRLRGRAALTLFEQQARLGGHTRTSLVDRTGEPLPVDTGFIVYNETNYPLFTQLLAELKVATQASDMSFGVSCERTGLEYSTRNVNGLFAQRRRLFDPRFLRVWRDFLRFGREAEEILAGEPADRTVAEYLEANGYSEWFRDWFVIPMAAAIWSATARNVLEFPVVTMVRFMRNHRMLQASGQPQWRVVRGGSRQYVDALYRAMDDVVVRRDEGVVSLRRQRDGVLLRTDKGETQRFDYVIVATHSDQALRLLSDADPVERDVLGAIRYQKNRAILHTDATAMPQRRRAWASWNYRIPASEGVPVSVTYDMTRLQSLPGPERYFVTLNREDLVHPDHIVEVIDYEHPIFDAAAIAAQRRRDELHCGRTFFAGAYWGFGFHEDGLRSGYEAADALWAIHTRRAAA
ncbi:MAG: dehydrogenase [Candidatus Dadabacteria bacterium]|nr:MAG: dehydrogenase [Candidatus Dadabacteria bacterium]